MANVSSERRHLLFLCKPEFGHMIPLLSLAQRLSVYHDITFAVSQIRLTEARARGMIPSCSTDSRVAFYGVEDGLTEPSEHDIPFRQIVEESFQSGKMQSELLEIIPTKQDPRTGSNATMKPVDAIFCDILMTTFVAPILKARAVPLFMVESAGAELILLYLVAGQDRNQSNIKQWDGRVGFFELRPLDGPQAPIPDKFLAMLRAVWEQLLCAGALILNSHREAEAGLVAEIEKRVNAEVICCGPLIPSMNYSDRTTEDGGAIQWLDLQKAASVIYIGFGSLVTPALEQLKEIAKALCILKKPFVWSLKPVFHERLSSELAGTESLGKVYSWVPQQEVLMHKSVGVVLHHGGWGATQQTLTAGKPALVWPMASDEKMAGKYLVGKGAALMMEGTGVTAERLVRAEEIVKALVDVESTCKEGAESWGRKLRMSLEHGGASQKELERLANLVTKACCS